MKLSRFGLCSSSSSSASGKRASPLAAIRCIVLYLLTIFCFFSPNPVSAEPSIDGKPYHSDTVCVCLCKLLYSRSAMCRCILKLSVSANTCFYSSNMCVCLFVFLVYSKKAFALAFRLVVSFPVCPVCINNIL